MGRNRIKPTMSQLRPYAAGLALVLVATACSPPRAGTTESVTTIQTATLPSVVPWTETSAGAREVIPGDPTETPRPSATVVPATATVSPTNLRIVYIDRGNVMMIQDGGDPLELTQSGNADAYNQVVLSSDGARIAFMTSFVPPSYTPELRVVSSDGSGEALLLSPSDLTALHALLPGTDDIQFRKIEFLPGTHTLLLSTISAPIGAHRYDDLYALEVDTGELSTLLPPGAGGVFAASPDGRKVVFTTPDSVGLIDSDGSHYRPNLITFPAVETGDTLNQYYPIPVWADDSSQVGVVILSPDPLVTSASAAIWRLRSDVGSAIRVGEIRGDFYFAGFSPLLSPDFSRVAFGRPSGAPIGSDLYLASSDGTGEALYSTGVISWEGWAPDGAHFTYSYAHPGNLQLGSPDAAPAPFVPDGTDVRWINASEFLFLSGQSPAWTLNRGAIGGMPQVLVSPTGDFVPFDFDS